MLAKSLFLPDFLNEFNSLCYWLTVFSQWFHLKNLHIVSQTKKHHFWSHMINNTSKQWMVDKKVQIYSPLGVCTIEGNQLKNTICNIWFVKFYHKTCHRKGAVHIPSIIMGVFVNSWIKWKIKCTGNQPYMSCLSWLFRWEWLNFRELLIATWHQLEAVILPVEELREGNLML